MKRNLFIALLLLLTIELKAQIQVVSISGATTATWTAPISGGPFFIRITARGGDGGFCFNTPTHGPVPTGGGATMSGVFTVQNGETILAISGSKGDDNQVSDAGGGAGSGAVNSTTSTILLIAGAGGGNSHEGESVYVGEVTPGDGEGGADKWFQDGGGGGLSGPGDDGSLYFAHGGGQVSLTGISAGGAGGNGGNGGSGMGGGGGGGDNGNAGGGGGGQTGGSWETSTYAGSLPGGMCQSNSDGSVTFTPQDGYVKIVLLETQIFYQDADRDGFGNASVSITGAAGCPPDGYVSDNTDCNDNDPNVNPNTVWVLDNDNDGYYAGAPVTQCTSPGQGYVVKTTQQAGDCNDNDANINPNTVWVLDNDNDSYYAGDPVTQCTSPGTGYVIKAAQQPGDCDDNNAAINPNTVWVLDNDNDGYYTGDPVTQCTSPGTGYVIKAAQQPGDCNDNPASGGATFHAPSPASVTIADVPSGVICAGTPITFTATPANGGASPSYQWQKGGVPISGATNSTYTSSTLANNDMITVAMTASSNPCIIAGTVTSPGITVAVKPAITATASAGAIYCYGGVTILTITASGGTGKLQYCVNGSLFQIGNTFLVAAGTYIPMVKDAGGCIKILNAITITQPPVIFISLSAGIISCYGGTTTLTITASGGTPGYTYSLNGCAFQSNNTFTASATTCTVTVKDSKGCIAVKSVNISQPAAINVSAPAGTILCNGGTTTVTLSATGGTPPYTGTGTFTKSAGTYTFTVKDSKGCSGSKTITVSQPAILTASLSSKTNVLCYGSSTGSISVKGTGGTQPYTYKINSVSSYQSSSTFSNLLASTYSVTIMDKNGCTAVVTGIGITQPAAALTLILQKTDVSCLNGSNGSIKVSASGGASPYKYSLNSGSYGTSGNFSSLKAGTYTVNAKDGNSCTKSIPVVINNGTGHCNGLSVTDVTKANAEISDGARLKALVSPNPSEAEFTLTLRGNSNEPVEVRVVDIYGRSVHYAKGSANQSYKFGQRFAAGVYVVEMLQGKNVKTMKIVKGN